MLRTGKGSYLSMLFLQHLLYYMVLNKCVEWIYTTLWFYVDNYAFEFMLITTLRMILKITYIRTHSFGSVEPKNCRFFSQFVSKLNYKKLNHAMPFSFLVNKQASIKHHGVLSKCFLNKWRKIPGADDSSIVTMRLRVQVLAIQPLERT